MEKMYWLGRKRASLKAAQNALSAEAQLIHYTQLRHWSFAAERPYWKASLAKRL